MAVDEHGDSPRQLRRDLVISLLALASVAIGAYQLAREPPEAALTPLDALDLAIVAVFIVDFVAQARRSGDWRDYLKRHWWEVPSLVPASGFLVARLPGLSLVRGVRLLRLVRVLRLLRILGLAARFQRVGRFVLRVAHRARVFTILGLGAAVVGLGALAALLVESDVNERLATTGDAFWWALNMFTNVAYVDFQPRTAGGRALAAALELCGIVFIGILTASLANAVIKEPSPEEEDAERLT